MKLLPNILTLIRIFLSVPLLFISPLCLSWLLVYLICGITDILDGYFARKYNLTSNTGATLDSIADFIMVILVSCVLFTNYSIPIQLIILLVFVFFTRSISIIIGFIRYKKLVLLHTYLNKLAGAVIFIITPLYFLYPNFRFSLFIVISLFTIIPAMEELFINLTSKELNLNIKSIL